VGSFPLMQIDVLVGNPFCIGKFLEPADPDYVLRVRDLVKLVQVGLKLLLDIPGQEYGVLQHILKQLNFKPIEKSGVESLGTLAGAVVVVTSVHAADAANTSAVCVMRAILDAGGSPAYDSLSVEQVPMGSVVSGKDMMCRFYPPPSLASCPSDTIADWPSTRKKWNDGPFFWWACCEQMNSCNMAFNTYGACQVWKGAYPGYIRNNDYCEPNPYCVGCDSVKMVCPTCSSFKPPEPLIAPCNSTPRPTTVAPTRSPTLLPTKHPTMLPTLSPTENPTGSPVTGFPTRAPTRVVYQPCEPDVRVRVVPIEDCDKCVPLVISVLCVPLVLVVVWLLVLKVQKWRSRLGRPPQRGGSTGFEI